MLRFTLLGLSLGLNPDREYTRRQSMETCFLGVDLRSTDTLPLPPRVKRFSTPSLWGVRPRRESWDGLGLGRSWS